MLDSDEVYQMTKRGLDAAQIAAAKGIHLNLVLVKLLELHHLGYDLRHYHAQHHVLFSPDRRFDEYLRFQKESGLAHLRCCPLPAILASPFIFNKVSLLESHDRWWLFRVGHTDHLFRVCPNGWEGVSLAVDKSLLPYPCACSVTSTS